MNNLQAIIQKYDEFNDYLGSIDLNELKLKHSRKQLNDLRDLLYKIQFRSLAYEIKELTNKMKLEEYPELLGIHNYPEIKELDCISENDKIRLDQYIGDLGLRSYMHLSASSFIDMTIGWSKETTDKVLDFLVQKEILGIKYSFAVCDDHNGYAVFTQENIDNYFRYFELRENYNNLSDEEKEEYSEIGDCIKLDLYCYNCDDVHVEIDDIYHIKKCIKDKYNYRYFIAKERDKSLDNV